MIESQQHLKEKLSTSCLMDPMKRQVKEENKSLKKETIGTAADCLKRAPARLLDDGLIIIGPLYFSYRSRKRK